MNTTQYPEHDAKAFATWFCANNDIPEDVEPFDATEEGMYVWKEPRDGLA
jgi:hypothetical protein